jgi:hypothetical protein
MMRLRPTLVAILVAFVSASLDAQTIRGTVVDDGSKLPLSSVRVTLVDENGVDVSPGVRSDSLGAFIVHAARAGTWRVKGMLIGYGPVTSDPVVLAVGGLAVVRLRMTPVAQRLLPVLIVEQRQMSASELMSTTGFDLRESRGLGRFLNAERLGAMGRDGVREVLGTAFQPVLFVFDDPVLGDVLRIRQGGSQCEPEVYLDGRLLASAPEPGVVVDGPPPRTALDSMRAQMRAESEHSRVGFKQVSALSQLSALTANALHGIEVYRANEVPPPSLSAWFGMTKAAIRACGTVAIWTKAGARSLVTARSMTSTGRAIQVISGTLLDFDTGMPLAGRSVSLLSEGRDPIGNAVITDERGDFTLRTGRAGELRLTSGGSPYLTSTTPAFRVSVNEMVVVKLFVSSRDGVLAPLGVSARVLPQNIGVRSLAGFTYRRERGQGGTYFRSQDIETFGARTLADLARRVHGVAITDGNAIVMPRRDGVTTCTPNYYVDGIRMSGDEQTSMPSLRLTQVFGVEIYAREEHIPSVFTDAAGCGLIVVWTTPTKRD